MGVFFFALVSPDTEGMTSPGDIRPWGLETYSLSTNVSDQAIFHYQSGEFAEAEPLFKRSIAIREKVLGEFHPEVAHSLNNLAYCAMYNLTQGRYVAPFVILTLQGLTLELKEGNNGRVHHGTTIQAGVFTIHL